MPAGSDPYRIFRPRAARIIGLSVAGVVTVVTAILIIVPPFSFRLPDRIGIATVGAAIVWLCWRHASVVATPDLSSLQIRNLIHTTRLEWPQIMSVRFGSGRPWASLDLADGTTIAVMAIQSADGERGRAEARRLAALVQAYEAREPELDSDQP